MCENVRFEMQLIEKEAAYDYLKVNIYTHIIGREGDV